MKNIKLGVLTLTLLSSAVLAEGPAGDKPVQAPSDKTTQSTQTPTVNPTDAAGKPAEAGKDAAGTATKPGLWNSVKSGIGSVMPSNTYAQVAVGAAVVGALGAGYVYRKELSTAAKKLWTKICKNPGTTAAIVGAVVLAGLGIRYNWAGSVKSWFSKAPVAPKAPEATKTPEVAKDAAVVNTDVPAAKDDAKPAVAPEAPKKKEKPAKN